MSDVYISAPKLDCKLLRLKSMPCASCTLKIEANVRTYQYYLCMAVWVLVALTGFL